MFRQIRLLSVSNIYWQVWSTLSEKCWRISLYVTDDAIEKLYVTYSLVE